MRKIIQRIFESYDPIASRICEKHNQNVDGFLIKAKALLILWTSTTVVMWFYVLYCFMAFPANYPVPWWGLLFTVIHTVSPWIFKKTQSFVWAGLNISLSGLAFQTMFCLYTGGVYSPAAIWLTFHPVILGFFGSMEWILFSVSLNFIILICMYLAGNNNMLPPDILPPLFKDGMILTSYIGLDILVAFFTITAIKLNLRKNAELNKSKDLTENLVRVLVHDIKNPLSIIQVASKNLDPVKTNSPLYAEKIIRAGDDIQKITASVNSWMSHKDGKMKLQNQLISIKDIIDHLEFSFEDKLIQKNLSMKLAMNCENHCIWGDKTAVFYQVFNNLISNAIKFSYEGSQIDVLFSADQENVYVSIRDYGVGIDENVIEKVFSPYAVTSSPGTNNEKGTGWGLPIVSTVVEKMEGKIKIINMKNSGEQGTRVNLSFPRHT